MKASNLAFKRPESESGMLVGLNHLNVCGIPFCANDDLFEQASRFDHSFSDMKWQIVPTPEQKPEQKPEPEPKPFVQRFKGYMKLYLDADTVNELIGMSVFTQHWATRRHKILRKPRRYKVNLYMYNTAGDKEHDQIKMIDAGGKEELWQIIVDYAQQVITDNPDIEFDRGRCNAVIRA